MITEVHYLSYDKNYDTHKNAIPLDIYAGLPRFWRLPPFKYLANFFIQRHLTWIDHDISRLSSGKLSRAIRAYELKVLGGQPVVMAQGGPSQ